jgi:Hydrolase of X-linked nucleoside diphosphate N terminal
MSIQPDWLRWARKLQALAQTGLTYAQNPYDNERYRQLQKVAAEIFAAHTGKTLATVEQWFAIQPGYATPKVDVRGACFRDGKPAGARKIGRYVVLAGRLGRRR